MKTFKQFIVESSMAKSWVNSKTGSYIEVPRGYHHIPYALLEHKTFGLSKSEVQEILDDAEKVNYMDVLWNSLAFYKLWKNGWVRCIYQPYSESLQLHNGQMSEDEARKVTNILYDKMGNIKVDIILVDFDNPRKNIRISGQENIEKYRRGRMKRQSPLAAFR